ncbi:hypothetical protein [Sneathiella limimaris]|uniref:hypothetical protein n=1 Tax=Sneathiella limimaris TaxID=1964213 RepID=UPI00146E3116|nr:hypothetical protein [Sneathiella limimaris]
MNFAVSIAARFPVLGWFIKDAQNGPDINKILFIVNFVLLWILATYLFGYPALIITALSLVPIVFLALISVTARDCFPRQQS